VTITEFLLWFLLIAMLEGVCVLWLFHWAGK
jgi:hypothetical protein